MPPACALWGCPVQRLVPRAQHPRAAVGALALALLMGAGHVASFGFVIAGGRLLTPAQFGTLVAVLGIVLVGMAPGMAVQALSAAGTLGRPVTIDAHLARRLALGVAALVMLLLLTLGRGLGASHPAVVATTTAAAALLPLTAAREGVLIGRRRVVALGAVLMVGAVVKLVTGVAGMAATAALWAATAGIALGYLAQLATSHRLAGGLPRRAPGESSPRVLTAAVTMGLLLALVHVDAVLAQLRLDGLDAGRYGVGVTAARIIFWGPQFVMFLLYPRLVTDDRGRVVAAAIAALLGLGAVAGALATAIGPAAVGVVFGSGFAPIGAELWRFAWLGSVLLGLQVLALSDLATQRRATLGLLGVTLVALVAAVLALRPSTPVGVVTLAAAVVSVALLGGTVHRVGRPATAQAPAGEAT
jgi:hypothetical protein